MIIEYREYYEEHSQQVAKQNLRKLKILLLFFCSFLAKFEYNSQSTNHVSLRHFIILQVVIFYIYVIEIVVIFHELLQKYIFRPNLHIGRSIP